jgi:hypothetical protein
VKSFPRKVFRECEGVVRRFRFVVLAAKVDGSAVAAEIGQHISKSFGVEVRQNGIPTGAIAHPVVEEDNLLGPLSVQPVSQ